MSVLISNYFKSLKSEWLKGAAVVGLLSLATSASALSVSRGDVNSDGRINTADAIFVLRAAVGLEALTPIQKQIADVNADGRVNAIDAGLILRRAVGLIPSMGTVETEDPQNTAFTTAIENNETVISWPTTGKKLASVTFTQGAQTVNLSHEIIVAGDRDTFRLQKKLYRQIAGSRTGNDYSLFDQFQANQPVKINVIAANDASDAPLTVGSTEINPCTHAFDPGVYGVDPPVVTLDGPIPGTATVGQTVTVSGTVLSSANVPGLRAFGYVIGPNGLPQKQEFQSSQPFDTLGLFGPKVSPGNDFRMNFKIEGDGVYIVEINDYAGLAAINQPIYVGTGLPLVPNPLDSQGDPATTSQLDVVDAKAHWLELINTERQRFGLQPVVLDEALNQAAQAYTDDMSANNYFGHIGMDGSDPLARAIRAGVSKTTAVGENLAQGVTVDEMHSGLLASAIHRSNLLNPNWRRIGLGITRYQNGLLFGAEEFGAAPGEYDLEPDFFGTLQLDSPISTGFKVGKTVTVSGNVLNGAKTAFLFFIDPTQGRQFGFPSAPVPVDAQGHFSIDVTFSDGQVGSYQMGISLDQKSSKAAYVVVSSN